MRSHVGDAITQVLVLRSHVGVAITQVLVLRSVYANAPVLMLSDAPWAQT